MTTLEETLESSRPSLAQALAPLAALAVVVAVVGTSAGSQTVWYVIRGSGIIAFALLTLSMVVGLLITNRTLPAGRPRVDLYEVHTFTTLLALAFTGVHAVALLLDSFIGFSPLQIVVPFTADYRPLAVSLGILGGYVAAAVYGSFWLRRQIGYKTWRTLHYASFLAFIMADLHGIFAGSDSGASWMIAVYAVATIAVVGLTLRRAAMMSRPVAQRA